MRSLNHMSDHVGLETADTNVINGTDGDDNLTGTSGNDIMSGLGGSDTIHAGDGDDQVLGGDGDDYLYGGAGNDTLVGGAGDDYFKDDAGVDSFDGGAGFDRISFYNLDATQGASADLRTGVITNDGFGNRETFTGIEGLGGGTPYADQFYGDDNNNSLFGGYGDTLMGYGGDDGMQISSAGTFDGGTGTDYVNLVIGSDDIYLNGQVTHLTPTTGWTIDLESGTLVDGFGFHGTATNFEDVYLSVTDGAPGLVSHVLGTEGANYFEGSTDIEVYTGRGGNDTFAGYFDELDGDTITDLAIGDRVKILGDTANYSLSNGVLTLQGGPERADIAIGDVHLRFLVSFDDDDSTTFTAIAAHTPTSDFDGDGSSGILFQNSDGSISSWEVNGGNTLRENTYFASVDPSWHAQETFDMNGDGHADILWRNDNGALSVWTGSADGFQQSAYNATVGTEWHIVATGDLNGDNLGDIVFQRTDGAIAAWSGEGGLFNQNAYFHESVGGTWAIKGVGDFNGDGDGDLLWRDASGAFSIWSGTGADGGDHLNYFTENTYFDSSVGTEWTIAAIADFNGDGKDDLLFRNVSGAISVWTSTGTGFAENTYYNASVGNDWSIAQTGDFNGDGKADILWHNVDGAISIWSSNGAGFDQNTLYDPGPATSWHIAAHDFV